MATLTSDLGRVTSLQVSFLGDIPSGKFKPNRAFLVKNITDAPITLSVKTIDGSAVQTVLYPGWNPEIIVEVVNAPAKTLQYGY